MADIAPIFRGPRVNGANIPIFQTLWTTAWDAAYVTAVCDYHQACGRNLARFLIDVQGVYDGFSLATLLANIDTVCNALKARGSYLYPCLMTPSLCSTVVEGGSTGYLATCVAIVTHMEAQSYVDYRFAYDLCNEPKLNSGGIGSISAAIVSDLYTGCKAVAPGVPMTVAHVIGYGDVSMDQATGDAHCTTITADFVDGTSASYLAYCDFMDLHIYYLTPGSTAFQAVNTSFATKKFVLGEWGMPRTFTTTQRTNQANAIFTAIANATCLGDAPWDLSDYDIDANNWNQYGLTTQITSSYAAAGRNDLLVPVRKNMGWSVPTAYAPSGLRVSGNLVKWDPVRCSAFATERVWINGTQVQDDAFALYKSAGLSNGDLVQVASNDGTTVSSRASLIVGNKALAVSGGGAHVYGT